VTREQLEHLIRASAAITGIEDIVVIGSQAVLGEFPGAPEELLVSQEADVFPLDDPGKGELIDGSIGEGSPFQRSFGYAHGMDDKTAILPQGWKERLILVTGAGTRDARGWCLEIHDLAIAKYAAGREKDLSYTRALAKHRMVRRDLLGERLAATALDRTLRGLTEARIKADFEGV
jgi:hypothetical protein